MDFKDKRSCPQSIVGAPSVVQKGIQETSGTSSLGALLDVTSGAALSPRLRLNIELGCSISSCDRQFGSSWTSFSNQSMFFSWASNAAAPRRNSDRAIPLTRIDTQKRSLTARSSQEAISLEISLRRRAAPFFVLGVYFFSFPDNYGGVVLTGYLSQSKC